ncbi:hypothetical protein LXA43DRAFT_1012811 [Ganoderma leucocontextum]|nr:hypothetical protein LXA43DRAFT_1012811 [Ganoderma leucocontextum]
MICRAQLGVKFMVLSCVHISLSLTLMSRTFRRRCQRRAQPTSIILCLTIVALFTSTTIESGAVYCAIWSVVVAFQICEYNWWNTTDSISTAESRFLNIGRVLLNGAPVPGIAIYPAFIIALVALNRSHIEKGSTQPLESLPTPHVAVTLNTIATSPHERRSHPQSEVLVIDGQELGCGNGSEVEGTSERGSKDAELKVQGILFSRVPLDHRESGPAAWHSLRQGNPLGYAAGKLPCRATPESTSCIRTRTTN